jgi:NAD(P)H-hydrate epimerase
VLSGALAAMLAKGLEPFEAACAAVRLHALAGIRAGAARGVDSVIASDVIEELGAVLSP